MTAIKKKKLWLKVILGVVVLLVLAAIVALAFIDSILKTGIQTIGSTVTKCNVSVDNVDLCLRKGELLIENFVVRNPAGYKTDKAIGFGKIFISLVPASLIGDPIRIKQVEIVAPELTYELGLGNSNLGTILDNINSMFPPKDDKKDDKPKEEKAGKKVEIDLVEIKDGKIAFSAKLLGGKALPIPLPSVSIKDIGKEKDEEVGMVEASAEILQKMLVEAVKSVGKAGTAILDGAKDAGAALTKGLKDTSDSLTKGLKDTSDSLTEGLKGTSDGLTEGLKGTSDGLTEGLKGTSDGVTETVKGVKDAGKSLMNIFSGGAKEQKATEEQKAE